MTKKKGPKKAKTLFSVARIARKKTRHLKMVPAPAAEVKADAKV
jgi:hypothetical protein